MAASGSPGLNTHSLSYKKYARNANTSKMIIPKNAKIIKRKFPDMYKKEELFNLFSVPPYCLVTPLLIFSWMGAPPPHRGCCASGEPL